MTLLCQTKRLFEPAAVTAAAAVDAFVTLANVFLPLSLTLVQLLREF